MPSRKSASSSKSLGVMIPSFTPKSVSAVLLNSDAESENVLLVSNILSILFVLIVLSYIVKVENNCNVCANDTNIKTVKLLSIGLIIYFVLLMLFPVLYHPGVTTVLLIVWIIYLVNIIRYVKKMNTHPTCHSCASDWRKSFMNIIAYIFLTINGIYLIVMIALLLGLSGVVYKALR